MIELYRTGDSRVWVLRTDNGVERLDSREGLIKRLRELGVKQKLARRCRPRCAKRKMKYSFKVANGSKTIFAVNNVSEETAWVLYEFAEKVLSIAPLFTEIIVSAE